MGMVLPAAAAITYVLVRKRRFALTSTVAGLCMGGSAALATGNSHWQQLAVLTLVSVTVTGGLYWMLCRMAVAVADDNGHYRIPYPLGESGPRVGRCANPSDDPHEGTVVNDR